MIWVISAIVLLLVAIFPKRLAGFFGGWISRFRRNGKDTEGGVAQLQVGDGLVRWAGALGVFLCLMATSFVSIDAEKTGHKNRIYAINSLKPGQIIATGSTTAGPQAETIPPGVHFSPFIRVFNNIEELDILDVPDGRYAYLVARDGLPLSPGQAFADPVSLDQFVKFVTDAEYALSNGLQRGPQAMALPPGKWRINRYLWEAKLGKALDVEKGTVAVIKANVKGAVNFGSLSYEAPEKCDPLLQPTTEGDGALSVPVVPVGCQGIWKRALPPGRYYINLAGGAYSERIVDTRLQQWEYKGGYSKRVVHLKVGEDGKLTQDEQKAEEVRVPQDAADQAIFAKVEGWDVPIELRVLVQVKPEDAPFTVAAVGGLQEVEDRVITPAIRAVTRDVAGGMIRLDQPVTDDKGNIVVESGKPKTTVVFRKTQVLDLITNRPALEGTILDRIRPEGEKARVAIKEVRFGESVIPPEVLIPQQRKQLAEQLGNAYMQEKTAQDQRITVEQARATADQQKNLVTSQIDQQRSLLTAQARENEGLGEKKRLMAIAEGQRIQAAALGEERVMELRKYEIAMEKIFEFLNGHPDVIVTGISNAQKFVPDRVFTIGAGGQDSAVGAFGILGELLNPANGGPGRITDKK